MGDVVFPETKLGLRERAKRTVWLLERCVKEGEDVLIVGHGSSVEALTLGLVPEADMEWVTCKTMMITIFFFECF